MALLVEDKRLENSKKKKRSLKSMLSSSESKDDKPVGRRRASDKGIASSDSVDSDMNEGDLMEEEEEDCEREESSVGSRDESMDDEEEGSASEKNKIKTVDPDDMSVSSNCHNYVLHAARWQTQLYIYIYNNKAWSTSMRREGLNNQTWRSYSVPEKNSQNSERLHMKLEYSLPACQKVVVAFTIRQTQLIQTRVLDRQSVVYALELNLL